MNETKYKITEILNYSLLDFDDYTLTVKGLIGIILIALITKVLLSILRKAILKSKKMKNLDEGSLYSVIRIFNYIGWTLAGILMLDTAGVKVTVLLTSSAGLLLGLGIGLQQIFKDFVSGIVLLLEGHNKVGDILQVDDDIVVLKDIGLRTSLGVNRDDVTIMLPNSKIINDKVINWSHQHKKTRFRIDVGVAYGSDIDLVIEILKNSALEHPDIYNKDSIEARFVDFGASSLNFQLMFYSRNIFRIGRVQSDIRKIIYRKFQEHGITIPFPQMDVHMKNNELPSVNNSFKECLNEKNQ